MLSCVGVVIEENGHEGGLKWEDCFLSSLFSITSLLLINNVFNSDEDWHRKLDHPSSIILSHSFKFSLLGYKVIGIGAFVLFCLQIG